MSPYGHLEQRAAHQAMLEVAERLKICETKIATKSTYEGEHLVTY